MIRKLVLMILLVHVGLSLFLWLLLALSFRALAFGEAFAGLAGLYSILCMIFGIVLLGLSLIGWLLEVRRPVVIAWLVGLPIFVVTWAMLAGAPHLPFALAFEASRGSLERLAANILADPESFRERSRFSGGFFQFGSFEILDDDVVVLRMGQLGKPGHDKGFVRVYNGIQLGKNWLSIPSESKGLYVTSIPSLDGTGHPWYGLLTTLGGFVKPAPPIPRSTQPLGAEALPSAILGVWRGYSQASIGQPAIRWESEWEFRPKGVAVFDSRPDYRYALEGDYISIVVNESLGFWTKGTRTSQAGLMYGTNRVEIIGEWLVISGPRPPENYTHEIVDKR